jgi:Holliday junction resolvase
MTNKNYRRGYETELKAKERLEKDGYYVMRSSGSRSIFDLIALNKSVVRLIQLKRVKGKRGYFAEDIGKIREFSNYPSWICQKELWIWHDRDGFDIQIIKGDENDRTR